MRILDHSFALILLGLLAIALSPGAPAAESLVWQPLNEAACGGAMTALSISPHDGRRVLVAGDMLGIGISADLGDTWQCANGLPCYEIADFTWHPTERDEVWAGSMGGPMVSRDGGRTWAAARNGFPPVSAGSYSAPIEKILFDPRDSRRLLAFGGSSRGWESPGKPLWGAVWESRDDGGSWSRLTVVGPEGTPPAEETAGVNLIAAVRDPVAPDTVYVAARGVGILVSTDSGTSWHPSRTGLPSGAVARLVAHPTAGGTLWASFASSGIGDQRRAGDVYRTTDGGTTWKPCGSGLAHQAGTDDNFSSRYGALAISPLTPDVLFTNDGAWNTGVIYRSTDGGAAWQAVATKANIGHGAPAGINAVTTFYPAGLGMGPSIVSPVDPQVVLFANSEFIVRSRDGGTTWEDITARPVAGGDGWRGTGYSGLCSINVRFNPAAPDWVVLNAMDAGKLLQSRDGMRSWTIPAAKPNPWMGGNDTAFAGPTTAYTTLGQHGTFGGIATTTDGGATWTVRGGAENGLPKAEGRGDATGVCASPAHPEVAWAVVNGDLLRTGDAGGHWRTVDTGHWLTWLASDPSAGQRFYAAGAFNIYRCDDGATLVPIGGPRGGGRIAVDVRGILYAVGNEGRNGGSSGLWRHDGSAWTRLLADRFLVNVAIDPVDPTRLLACTNEDPFNDVCDAAGVYLSADSGRTWTLMNAGLGMLRGYGLAFAPADHEQVVFGSFGRGYFTARWPAALRPVGTPGWTPSDEDQDLVGIDPLRHEPGKPFLANGGMENGAGLPTGWDSRWTGEGQLRAFRDRTIAHDGRASLALASVGGAAKGSIGQTVEGGFAHVTVGGALRSAGKARVLVALQSFDAGWKPLDFAVVKMAEGDSGWSTFAGEVVLPAATARFNVLLFVEGDGCGWLDSVTLAAAP